MFGGGSRRQDKFNHKFSYIHRWKSVSKTTVFLPFIIVSSFVAENVLKLLSKILGPLHLGAVYCARFVLIVCLTHPAGLAKVFLDDTISNSEG